jgi:cell division transport system ATP-binding protein
MREVLHIGSNSLTSNSLPKEGATALIEFKNATKEYAGRVALKDVSITVKESEFISLVGQSGVGKTTLIKLLTKQENPTKGQIYVAGRNLAELRSKEIPLYRRKIGVVFQDFKLLPQKTVWENVAFALEVCGFPTLEINRRTEKVLDLVNMGRRKNNYPHELSGGERQRTAIARSLVHSPKILIADEPTGNLDPVNTWEIIELLYRINQRGTTIILATHNRQVVDKMQRRVILMKSGKVVSDQVGGKYVI